MLQAPFCYNGREMLDHHLQRAIVYRLAFTTGARFSELKPDDIENKLFTYHLKKVMAAGYVEKDEDGTYHLTAEGRRLGYQAMKSERFMLDKAYSVLFLVVRDAKGRWLLSKRNMHPLMGYTTFPIATPTAEKLATQTAADDLLAKTGLQAQFRALGGGYFHVYKDDELESYTNFTLMICDDASGDLQQNDPNSDYAWFDTFNLADHKLLPDMPLLLQAYERGEPFFLEEIIKID